MKLFFTALLCLLLAGCSAPEPSSEPAYLPTDASPAISDSLHSRYGSNVKAISLPLSEVQQICTAGRGILLQSGANLVMLDEEFQVNASAALDFVPRLQVTDTSVAAFDESSRQLLILDFDLQRVHSVTLPPDLSGFPVLSSNQEDLYYCTQSGIYHWELDTNIRHRIRESGYEDQQLMGLHWDDTVLQCRILSHGQPQELFLRANNGQFLQSLDSPADLITKGQDYYCSYITGNLPNRCFGSEGEAPQGLFPRDIAAGTFFLPGNHAAITVSSSEETDTILEYYDLSTGRLRDSITLDQAPKAFAETSDGTAILIHHVEGDVLLLWSPSQTASDTSVYTAPWFTSGNPDHAGLAQCRNFARQLSETYGVEILIQEEATAVQPWDYTFEAEYRCPVILSQLDTLEKCLSRYPREILESTRSRFDGLKICLVQSIAGTGSTGSLSAPTGIQFFRAEEAYLMIASGPYREQALNHEFFHLMETRILSCSGALDQWDALNPAGFSYDMDLGTNADRNAGVYLSSDSRAFVDTYSMSYPREDRARIFEYAMLPGQTALFRSDILQRKLSAICTGIREAYGLEDAEEIFPWEQYLQ